MRRKSFCLKDPSKKTDDVAQRNNGEHTRVNRLDTNEQPVSSTTQEWNENETKWLPIKKVRECFDNEVGYNSSQGKKEEKNEWQECASS